MTLRSLAREYQRAGKLWPVAAVCWWFVCFVVLLLFLIWFSINIYHVLKFLQRALRHFSFIHAAPWHAFLNSQINGLENFMLEQLPFPLSHMHMKPGSISYNVAAIKRGFIAMEAREPYYLRMMYLENRGTSCEMCLYCTVA